MDKQKGLETKNGLARRKREAHQRAKEISRHMLVGYRCDDRDRFCLVVCCRPTFTISPGFARGLNCIPVCTVRNRRGTTACTVRRPSRGGTHWDPLFPSVRCH